MAVLYTRHAERRISQRKIPQHWVEAVIARPDRETADPRDPRLTRAYKRLSEAGGHVLRVVYFKKDDDIVVVTAFPDRDA